MSNVLRIAVRFLTPEPSFHGKRDGGEPEWPPSPLRLFQALVDAAASRWRGSQFDDCAEPALARLEGLRPEIVTPTHVVGTPFRTAVPNNDLDVWAGPISKGNEPKKQPNELKTMKTIQPIRIRFGEGKDRDSLHYLYPLPNSPPDKQQDFVNVIAAAARSVTHLGWGIDMVAADAKVISQEEADELPGQRWQPDSSGGVPLRVPKAGSLEDLRRKHEAFLGRLSADGFRPVPPLTEFRIVHYRRATDPPRRPVAAFSLLRIDASGFRAFGTTQHTSTVSAMLRHATYLATKDGQGPDLDPATIVLGHGEPLGDKQHQPVGPRRFAYLPLPSLEYRGGSRVDVVGAVRRVLITSFGDGLDEQIAWARRALSGAELKKCNHPEPEAFLSALPTSDKMVQRYLRESSTWTSVTPVVLPGYDDPGHVRRRLKQGVSAAEQRRLLEKLSARVDSLLRKAILQAGFSPTLANHAKLEWRDAAFLPGADLASRYQLANHLQKHSRLHVRIEWCDANGAPVTVPGPICLGGGRYGGMGLLVGIDRSQ